MLAVVYRLTMFLTDDGTKLKTMPTFSLRYVYACIYHIFYRKIIIFTKVIKVFLLYYVVFCYG